jgi:hypothetical protein
VKSVAWVVLENSDKVEAAAAAKTMERTLAVQILMALLSSAKQM